LVASCGRMAVGLGANCRRFLDNLKRMACVWCMDVWCQKPIPGVFTVLARG
jgi:hypothetical protein